MSNTKPNIIDLWFGDIKNVNKMHHDEEDTTDKTSGYTINIRSKAEELMVTALELN